MGAAAPELVVDGAVPSQPVISPDGRWVAYVVAPVGRRGERRLCAIWLAAADGSSPPRKLTAGTAADVAPRWSPDSASMYAVNEGGEWMLLTNGQVWQVWHLTAGLPVLLDMAFEVDLLADGGLTQKVDSLFYLSKEAFKRHAIDDLWRVKAATSAKSLGTVITSDAVVEEIRKELRRQTGHNSESGELRELLVSSVLRPECL